mmetsp:Transcript_10459/g.15842  ORF Transcript_10459/g.15842 Transcript_10459/m.15842 type:complete len:84 (+) Transcript_10459:119-370(+)
MQGYIAASMRRSVASGRSINKAMPKTNFTARRNFQRRVQKDASASLRLAIGNEISCTRLLSAIKGCEESIVRGWDFGVDDDGG